MVHCFCCNKRFAPNESYHTICAECSQEYSPDWHDEKLMCAVRGLHSIAYGDLTDEAMEFLAGSAAWSITVRSVMDQMRYRDWDGIIKAILKHPPEE